MKNNPKWLIIHHTLTGRDKTTFNAVNNYHKGLWNFRSSLGYYIGYQHYIDLDGKITQGRSNTEEGAHTLGGWNRKSIGICLQGNLNISIPRGEQLLSLEDLIGRLQVKYDILSKDVFMHKELWMTACPGKNMTGWVKSYRESDITYLQIKIYQIRAMLNELKLLLSTKI